MNTLQNLMKDNRICEVYTDINDTKKFSVGYIVGCDDEFFLMEHIDPYGRQDGIFCKPIDNIIKIETDSIYVKNIEKLFRLHNDKRYCDNTFGNEIVLNVLKYAQNSCKVCSIELCESGLYDATGFITDIAKGKVTVKSVSEYGAYDGISVIDVNDISEISCDSLDERKLEELYNMQ